LDKILVSEFQNDKGVKLPIMATCIDSGYATAAVYQFCRDRMRRRIYAIKGQAGRRPVWPRRVSKGKDKSPLFIVGTDACKDWIVAHLKIYAPGPGYIHFPMTIDRIFFEQLTSETIRIRYSKGFAIREWYKMPGARNEVLDFTCYAFAALQSLAMSGIRLNAYAEKMEAIQADAPAEDKPQQQSREGWPIRRKQSWLGDRTQNWLRR
jgi:phage terminase large subunit GpA-like protein